MPPGDTISKHRPVAQTVRSGDFSHTEVPGTNPGGDFLGPVKGGGPVANPRARLLTWASAVWSTVAAKSIRTRYRTQPDKT